MRGNILEARASRVTYPSRLSESDCVYHHKLRSPKVWRIPGIVLAMEEHSYRSVLQALRTFHYRGIQSRAMCKRGGPDCIQTRKCQDNTGTLERWGSRIYNSSQEFVDLCLEVAGERSGCVP
jgi:hypothetical protein